MRFYTTEVLGPRQELTPEKFLLCRDVPIARTGTMLYAEGEIPGLTAVDGIVRVDRDPAEVFREETLASFEGKAFTLDHPAEDVIPENWSRLAKGIVENVRRGAGIDDDLMLADILVTDQKAIEQIREKGLREVSAGYDASYEQTVEGRARQFNIIGNHVALVDQGRCGYRCAIGDKRPMNRLKFIDRLRAAFRSRDEAALEKALEESLGGATAGNPSGPAVKTADASAPFADALEQLVERVKALEVSLATRDCRATKDEEEEEEEHEDQKKKGKDKKTGATSTELFQPRLRKSSSHPAHWDKRGDMELTGGPVPERLILVDDIATSGTTIEHAVQMLRAANPGMVILPVVWIYEDA